MNARAGLPLLAVALGVLTACGKGNPDRGTVSLEDQTAVAAAVEHLRQSFNQGTCAGVLDAAVEQHRAHTDEWVERCEHIRSAWGEWRSFDAASWYRAGAGVVAVEGVAGFSRGKCIVQVGWRLQPGPPRMAAFILSSPRDRVTFPPWQRQYRDPPVRFRAGARGATES